VVLRTIDKEQSILEIHTNIHSAKIVDLKANSAAGLHIWDEACRLQIRVSAQASVIYGQAVECTWSRVPLDSRKAYSGSAIPGTPISSSNAYDSVPDVNAFAVIKLHILEMDLLHLGAQHRRARFTRDDAWAGQWLIP
jgi:pyridoxine/pyridoxamine 5'-phosphate oxidase